jgi:cytochrome c oxidase subunit 3
MSESSLASHHSHEPVPSKWPILTAAGAGMLPIGIVLNGHGNKAGMPLILLGLLVTILGSARWWAELLRDKFVGRDLTDADARLKVSFKLFIASEAMIFGAFFAALFYARFHAGTWPPAGMPHFTLLLPAVNTFLLLFSSVTCHFAHMALERGKQEQFIAGLMMTMFLGAVFLCGQAYEYGVLNGEAFNIQSGIFGTTFFMLTGFHGLHVLMGVVFLNVVYGAAMRGRITKEQHFPFLAASWYWHFVDAIWVVVFSVVYLWK